MKIFYVILILLFSCTYQRDVEVSETTWVLKERKLAYRYNETRNVFVWLKWENERGNVFFERANDTSYNSFPIGMRISNRDKN